MVDDADTEGFEGEEVLRAYWDAVARLERRIERLGSLARLSHVGPPELGPRLGWE